MKKLIATLIIALFVGLPVSVVRADPGPYDATMNLDGYDPTPDSVLTPNDTDATENPQVWEALNQVFINALLPSPGYISNPSTDSAQVTGPNAYWHDIAPAGQSGDFAVVSITAANTNTLGVFKFGNLGSLTFVTPSETGFTFLGDGSVGDPYPGGINPYSSDNFGFALKSVGVSSNTWYSDPALNSDGIDHMLAFYLPGLAGKTAWIDLDGNGSADQLINFTPDTYLLAWEDLPVDHSLFDSDYNDTIFLVTKVTPIPEPMSLGLLGSGLAALVGLRKKRIS